MDREIHKGYRLFPGNYVALDMVNGNRDNSDKYTEADEKRFKDYIQGQLDKIDIPGKDERFLREKILTMYANPVRNKAIAERGE